MMAPPSQEKTFRNISMNELYQHALVQNNEGISCLERGCLAEAGAAFCQAFQSIQHFLLHSEQESRDLFSQMKDHGHIHQIANDYFAATERLYEGSTDSCRLLVNGSTSLSVHAIDEDDYGSLRMAVQGGPCASRLVPIRIRHSYSCVPFEQWSPMELSKQLGIIFYNQGLVHYCAANTIFGSTQDTLESNQHIASLLAKACSSFQLSQTAFLLGHVVPPHQLQHTSCTANHRLFTLQGLPYVLLTALALNSQRLVFRFLGRQAQETELEQQVQHILGFYFDESHYRTLFEQRDAASAA